MLDRNPNPLCVCAQGNIPAEEMCRTFNCGIGAVLVVDRSLAPQITRQLTDSGEKAGIIGHVEKQSGNIFCFSCLLYIINYYFCHYFMLE